MLQVLSLFTPRALQCRHNTNYWHFCESFPLLEQVHKCLVLVVALRIWEYTSSLSSLFYTCGIELQAIIGFIHFQPKPACLEGLRSGYRVTYILPDG